MNDVLHFHHVYNQKLNKGDYDPLQYPLDKAWEVEQNKWRAERNFVESDSIQSKQFVPDIDPNRIKVKAVQRDFFIGLTICKHIDFTIIALLTISVWIYYLLESRLRLILAMLIWFWIFILLQRFFATANRQRFPFSFNCLELHNLTSKRFLEKLLIWTETVGL